MGQCTSTRSKESKRWSDVSSTTSSSSSSEKRGWLALVRERRSRFYIVRRCVVMLLCWHKYGKY
ncbi:hypothetical protein AQUCO_03500121v1 [Aquilegia coerulea]|uniref:Uncharacterized protein n=1 Tax=Aquilegia coerulea TaxID=218851 RepID=A0A2G5CWA2_AQUCA|nr:hypothetical protein AQUCO_03500121v1 [Aquilegia coerulea]